MRHADRPQRAMRQAFTLIELLVVVAVISILASLLMPTVLHAMDQGSASTCMGHLRQLTQACMLYATQYNQTVTEIYCRDDPWRSGCWWQECLMADGKVNLLDLRCPTEAKVGPQQWDEWVNTPLASRHGTPVYWYAHNRAYPTYQLGRPHRITAPNGNEWLQAPDVKEPGKVVYWVDSWYGFILIPNQCDPRIAPVWGDIYTRRTRFRHMNGVNLIYFDYHGEWMLGNDTRPSMWVPKW